ncbi:MAG: transporter substrate-binding domain-containing protein [Rhodovarius sp.]|nr:transporter substrate-binding domain-containing protein [Rhodovarius sp.]MCX7930949.1 transporter substrate-binding domain-containing protein [Rhodovarius sp.]MDW8314767.1 transporter substrate-binding domain-containing protein [Rhodovarius sp.]
MQRRAMAALAAALLAGARGRSAAQPPHPLAPTGRLRVGIGIAPVMSAFWASRDERGEPRGTTVELARALAAEIGARLELVAFNSSSEVVDAVAAGELDVAFVPIDAERAARLGVGPNYYLSVSTLGVLPPLAITRIAEADREDITIVGVQGTTTLRSAERAFPRARFLAAVGVPQALAWLRAGQAQAIALGLESLLTLRAELPELRILEGHFHALGTAIVVPPGRPEQLAAASAWMERAKADGTVRRALDAGGIAGPVAPAGSRFGA